MKNKKRVSIILAMLLAVMVVTTGFAAENAATNVFSFIANDETINEHFISDYALRELATGTVATVNPGTATGDYSKLQVYVRYLGNDINASGTKCTGYKTFSKNMFTLPYTSAVDSAGFYILCGYSGYGLFNVSGNWTPGL